MQFEIGQVLAIGNRPVNQDRVAAREIPGGVLLALADGLGGRPRGEEAAQTLVDLACRYFEQGARVPPDPQRLLVDIILSAHFAVLDLAPDAGSRPGTTGVVCVVRDGLAHWAHVGDSRLYLLRDGQVVSRTRDHSYVEQLYRQGTIRREEMKRHPSRNQLTQCIGGAERQPAITLGKPVALQPGDVLLLCSDGLWSGVRGIDMAAAVRGGDLATALDTLVREALRRTAPHSDNTSAIALRYLAGQPRPRPVQLAEQARRRGDGKLASAVEDIERVLRQYMDEMDDKH